MKKYTVEMIKGGQWAGFDSRGNQIALPNSDKWIVERVACMWAMSPGLFTTLKFKPVDTGSNYRAWEARPFYGVHAIITKHPQTDWAALVTVGDNPLDARAETFKTRAAAAEFVATFGEGKVTLRDAMTGKEFLQDRNVAGKPGICRSMESYYTM